MPLPPHPKKVRDSHSTFPSHSHSPHHQYRRTPGLDAISISPYHNAVAALLAAKKLEPPKPIDMRTEQQRPLPLPAFGRNPDQRLEPPVDINAIVHGQKAKQIEVLTGTTSEANERWVARLWENHESRGKPDATGINGKPGPKPDSPRRVRRPVCYAPLHPSMRTQIFDDDTGRNQLGRMEDTRIPYLLKKDWVSVRHVSDDGTSADELKPPSQPEKYVGHKNAFTPFKDITRENSKVSMESNQINILHGKKTREDMLALKEPAVLPPPIDYYDHLNHLRNFGTNIPQRGW